jgi:hypothetical protein
MVVFGNVFPYGEVLFSLEDRGLDEP